MSGGNRIRDGTTRGLARCSTCWWCRRRHHYTLRTSAVRSAFPSDGSGHRSDASHTKFGRNGRLQIARPRTLNFHGSPSVPWNVSLSDQRSPTAAFAGLAPQSRAVETFVLR
jgi:hypothetical protein